MSSSVTPPFYIPDIEAAAVANQLYRRVLYTSEDQQVVLMRVRAGVEVGLEKHTGSTQFIRVEKGRGQAVISGTPVELQEGSVVVVPRNTWHNVLANRGTDLRLYTIYSPPHHPDGRQDIERPEDG